MIFLTVAQLNRTMPGMMETLKMARGHPKMMKDKSIVPHNEPMKSVHARKAEDGVEVVFDPGLGYWIRGIP